MIRHILKLIWNRKRSNSLIIIEIFFSFIVLFALSTMIIVNVKNFTKPLGYDYEDVWVMEMKWNNDSAQAVRTKIEQITSQLKSNPEIKAVSLTGSNVPYAFSQYNDFVRRSGVDVLSNIHTADDDFSNVMNLQLVEGRWFDRTDNASRLKPTVINQEIKEAFFKNRSVIGETINYGEDYIVVGVVNAFRTKGEYSTPTGAFFKRANVSDSNGELPNALLIKVESGSGVQLEQSIMKEVAAISKDWTFEMRHLSKMRDNQFRIVQVPLIALSIIGAFLLINVALGLFGILWQNINGRFGEIGLRRAIGSTSIKIHFQFILEVMVVATFGIILGLILAIQLPLLNPFNIDPFIYILGILISIISIYILIIICAFYPSLQASSIEPAVALRDN